MSETIQSKKAVMSIQEFREWAGVGNTFVYQELKLGNLKAIKIGCRTLIRVEEAQRWLDSREAY
jgi:hypothetical protein